MVVYYMVSLIKCGRFSTFGQTLPNYVRFQVILNGRFFYEISIPLDFP